MHINSWGLIDSSFGNSGTVPPPPGEYLPCSPVGGCSWPPGVQILVDFLVCIRTHCESSLKLKNNEIS